jgi:hypothetical protein
MGSRVGAKLRGRPEGSPPSKLKVGGPSTNATLLPLQRMLVQLAGTTIIGIPTSVADSFVERRFIRHCAS